MFENQIKQLLKTELNKDVELEIPPSSELRARQIHSLESHSCAPRRKIIQSGK